MSWSPCLPLPLGVCAALPSPPEAGAVRRSFLPTGLPALLASVLLSLVLLTTVAWAGTAEAGSWSRLDLPDGCYALLFVPASLSQAATAAADPVPLVLFLHGAGSTPDAYRPFVASAAEQAGLALLLPKSVTSQGWGFADDGARLQWALDAAGAVLAVDRARTSLAGHSAGGAYAYLLAYQGGFPASAVFTLGAPFYPVTGSPPSPVPPIRMYYGTADPNYSGGSHRRLVEQWERLGVPWQDDVRDGYGHGNWPPSVMESGFFFLAAASRGAGCVPGPTVLCLDEGRFRVEVAWEDRQGGRGAGHVVPLGGSSVAPSSGLFWFFSEANWELMVKVLDGCGVNGHRWVFSAATTNVAYTLTVEDTESGLSWSHSNPAGRPAPAVTDTEAFRCP